MTAWLILWATRAPSKNEDGEPIVFLPFPALQDLSPDRISRGQGPCHRESNAATLEGDEDPLAQIPENRWSFGGTTFCSGIPLLIPRRKAGDQGWT